MRKLIAVIAALSLTGLTAGIASACPSGQVLYGWSAISSSGNCLTGKPANGGSVTSGTCNGAANQKWHFTLSGSVVLQYGSEAYCLDDAGNASPLNLQMWACNNDNAQRWNWTPYNGKLTAKDSEASLNGSWSLNGNGFPGYAQAAGSAGLSGVNMTVDGKLYVPEGVNLSSGQYPYGQYGASAGTPGSAANPWYLDGPGNPQYTSMTNQSEEQIDSAVNDWHANTVRFLFQQDILVNPSTGAVDQNYLHMIQDVVAYAKAKGVMMVLGAQTEPAGSSTANEPLPTSTTEKAWAQLIPPLGADKSVILDIFNEPRYQAPADSGTWNAWLNGGTVGGVHYLGFNALIAYLRSSGADNMLWVQTPQSAGTNEQGLGLVASDFSQWHVTDPGNLTVYAFHHPTVGGTPRTASNWNAQFANLARFGTAPVTDGEWANYTGVNSNLASNGDAGECWGDAPVTVPKYTSFLQGEGIGILGWALGTGSFTGKGFLNADDSSLGSASSYSGSYSCKPPSGTPTQGAGADLQRSFQELNP